MWSWLSLLLSKEVSVTKLTYITQLDLRRFDCLTTLDLFGFRFECSFTEWALDQLCTVLVNGQYWVPAHFLNASRFLIHDILSRWCYLTSFFSDESRFRFLIVLSLSRSSLTSSLMHFICPSSQSNHWSNCNIKLWDGSSFSLLTFVSVGAMSSNELGESHPMASSMSDSQLTCIHYFGSDSL